MSPSLDLNDRIERLMFALERFGVAPRKSLEEASGTTNPSMIRVSRIKAAGQKLIHPDLLVIDPCTGSLGLVYLVTSPIREHFRASWRRQDSNFQGGEREMLRELMNVCIDEAAHVRQLFLNHATARTHQVWSVELVFVTDLDAKQPELRSEVGEVFRAIQLQTSFLYSIGINEFVWPPEWNDEDFKRVISRALPAPESATVSADSVSGRDTKAAWSGHFRRAFAWLLIEVRKWVAEADQHSGRTGRRIHRHLQSIEVNHFRLPGTRTLTFVPDDGTAPNSRDVVQVIHGPNGSGKSSFVEALEYAVTRRIERLGEVEDDDTFRKAIVNRTVRKSNEAAVATARVSWLQRSTGVKSTDGKTRVCTLKLDERTHHRKTGFEPIDRLAFILDQVLMDRLTNARPADRSAAFLRAFFPNEEIALRRNFAERQTSLQTALSELPESVWRWLANHDGDAPLSDDALKPEAISRRLAWLDRRNSAVPRDLITACVQATLPKLQDLEELSRLDVLDAAMPSLSHTIGHMESEIPKEAFSSLLSELESVLNGLISSAPRRRKQIAEAVSVLNGLIDWQIERSSSHDDEGFRRDLDEWLETTAAEDLATRQLQVRTVVEKLAESREIFPGTHPPSLRPVIELSGSRLQSWRDEMQTRAKDACARLPRKSSAEESLAAAKAAGSRPARLSALQLKALQDVSHDAELVCQLVDGPSAPLDQLISDVIASHEPRAFGKIAIGEGNWAAELTDQLQELDRRLELLDQPDQLRRDRSRTGVSMIARLERVLKEAKDLDRLRSQLNRSFIAQLERADLPLNELMAMFTPARWAYEDLIVRQKRGSGSRSESQAEPRDAMSIEWRTAGDKENASLRFNTAQLNTRTLAMFLLSGIRMNNSLRLLVLDDPFDGMDELTIAAIARGLARLDRIFRVTENGWQLLVFVHSRTAFERLRHEIPGTSHKLPFHVPHLQYAESQRGKQAHIPSYETRILAPLRPGSASDLAPLTSLLTEIVSPKGRDRT
ncbi:AAA family ATPase [bacterium]|nr:AAA family ATPase [bacterium]